MRVPVRLPARSKPVIPRGVQFWKRGACVPVAMLLSQQMRSDQYIVQGWVRFGRGWQEHTWMLIDDGPFDPTLVQFKKFKNFPNCQRRIRDVRTVDEYRFHSRIAMKNAFWRNRVQMFGISPAELA
jgi:hypothetical protein